MKIKISPLKIFQSRVYYIEQRLTFLLRVENAYISPLQLYFWLSGAFNFQY